MTARWSNEGEAFLFYEVQKVLARYARGVDRKDWPMMLSAFHDDAIDDHGSHLGSPRQFVEMYSKAQEHVIGCMHLNGNTLILEVDRDRREVLVESYCVAWQRLSSDAPEFPPLFVTPLVDDDRRGRLMACGNRYLDLMSERDGDLRIARRTVIYEWLHVEPSDGQLQLRGRTLAERSGADASFTSLADFRAQATEVAQ